MSKGTSFVKRHLIPNFLVFIGSVLLAIGSAIFLVELNIVTGGLNGIGIIIQYFVSLINPDIQIIDLVVFVMTWSLWFVGLRFLGKEFAFKTLLSSIVYPLALAAALRIPIFQELAYQLAYSNGVPPTDNTTTVEVGRILLCGIFGGVSVGGGLALTFIGGGSTGGLDIIAFLLEKRFKIKQSLTILAIDGSIVLCGMFLIPNNFVSGLCGIIAAAITAAVVEIVYIGNQSCFIVDIISERFDEISKFAQDSLQRGTTIITAIGGYQGAQRNILRIVIPKSQYHTLRRAIKEIDPKAFVTFTQTDAVFGEGFQQHIEKK
jgi:uncharacterized membrane-anchored protein YitT (DUF2179 family)